jgi:hypothetical protein
LRLLPRQPVLLLLLRLPHQLRLFQSRQVTPFHVVLP